MHRKIAGPVTVAEFGGRREDSTAQGGFRRRIAPIPPAGGRDVSSTESESIELRIQALEIEHRDLDEIVLRLSDQPGIDELLLKRLKKRKLQLKDQIARLRSALIPDLDA